MLADTRKMCDNEFRIGMPPTVNAHRLEFHLCGRICDVPSLAVSL
jgi:hypothetical protein